MDSASRSFVPPSRSAGGSYIADRTFIADSYKHPRTLLSTPTRAVPICQPAQTLNPKLEALSRRLSELKVMRRLDRGGKLSPDVSKRGNLSFLNIPDFNVEEYLADNGWEGFSARVPKGEYSAELALCHDTETHEDAWSLRLQRMASASKQVERAAEIEGQVELGSGFNASRTLIMSEGADPRGRRSNMDALLWSFKDPTGPNGSEFDFRNPYAAADDPYAVRPGQFRSLTPPPSRKFTPLLTEEEKLQLLTSHTREQTALLAVQAKNLKDEIAPDLIQKRMHSSTLLASSGFAGAIDKTLSANLTSSIGMAGIPGARVSASMAARRRIAATRQRHFDQASLRMYPFSRDLRSYHY